MHVGDQSVVPSLWVDRGLPGGEGEKIGDPKGGLTS
jgi:hypothetical protein